MASKELQAKSRILAERISESAHIVDHDPSLALYRLQEHIGKCLPMLNNRKYAMLEVNAALQGACFDLDNITNTVQAMDESSQSFENIKTMLNSCLDYKKQLDLKNSLLKKEASVKKKAIGEENKRTDKT